MKTKAKRRSPILIIGCILVVIAVLAIAVKGVYGLYPMKYNALIDKYSEEYDVEKSLVYAVVHTESRFKPTAQSHLDAHGLMQITPDTFDWLQSRLYGSKVLEQDELYDPEINIKYGVYFISLLEDEFDDKNSVLAAYHAGRGSVNGWLAQPNYSSDGKTLDNIPYPDTSSYVEKVQQTEKIYKFLYKDFK